MNKLIKISSEHYIVVDDSEISFGNYCFDVKNKKVEQWGHHHTTTTPHFKKITHSTQPLEYNKDGGSYPIYVTALSLSEIEKAIYGYSVDKLAHEAAFCNAGFINTEGEYDVAITYYHQGFKAHQELLKDKLVLTKDQLYKVIAMSKMAKTNDGLIDMDSWISNGYEGAVPAYSEEEIIHSLLPKTEWKFEFDEHGKIKLL